MKRLPQIRSIVEAEKALQIGRLDAAMMTMGKHGFNPDSDGAFEACVRATIETHGRLADQRRAINRALEAENGLQVSIPSKEGADRVDSLAKLFDLFEVQLAETAQDLAKLRAACPHEDTALHGTCRMCGETIRQ